MRRILLAAVIASMPLVAIAQDFDKKFEKGLAAVRAGDYATELAELRPLAEQGNAEAQFNLGVKYANGKGVPLDYAEAMRWYRLAAGQGNDEAQFMLGLSYGLGRGVRKDLVMAYMWLAAATANGNMQSSKYREEATRQMTSRQVRKAEQRAHFCIVSHFTACD